MVLDSSGMLLKTKLVDNSITNCILGSVSDLLCNLIIHYVDIRTFLCYYLNRRVNKNLLAIIYGLNPEDVMMNAACQIS